jgi:hypothetical protein
MVLVMLSLCFVEDRRVRLTFARAAVEVEMARLTMPRSSWFRMTKQSDPKAEGIIECDLLRGGIDLPL